MTAGCKPWNCPFTICIHAPRNSRFGDFWLLMYDVVRHPASVKSAANANSMCFVCFIVVFIFVYKGSRFIPNRKMFRGNIGVLSPVNPGVSAHLSHIMTNAKDAGEEDVEQEYLRGVDVYPLERGVGKGGDSFERRILKSG